MNSVEICSHIAEIEGLDYVASKLRVVQTYASGYGTTSKNYNPFIDDELCFRLMIKYNVLRELTGNIRFRAVICNWGESNDYIRCECDNLNEAICLVIIKSNQPNTGVE